jgi:hypothetical protein
MKNAQVHARRILKKFSSRYTTFVLMIEIPDSVASELKARKVRLETRAYEIAFETIRAVSPINPRIAFLMSRTRGKIKDLEWLGEPSIREDFLDQTHSVKNRFLIADPHESTQRL